jgi:glycosyltransferase involved in cell wall biosynthesis
MNIVFISRSTPFHKTGGMEILSWSLAEELSKRGHQISYLTTRLNDAPKGGIVINSLDGTIPGRYSRAWWKLSRQFAAQLARKGKIDLVLSVGAGGFSVLDECRRFSIPSVMQAHGTFVSDVLSKLRARSLKQFISLGTILNLIPKDLANYPKFSKIVAVGRPVQEALLRRPYSWFVSKNKVILIENGVDLSAFCQAQSDREEIRMSMGIKPDDLVILTMARLSKQKGIDLSLCGVAEFVRSISKHRVKYLVAGEGPELRGLQSLSRSLGIADSVTFLGKIEHDHMAATLRCADVFLFTTLRKEGLPLNILEAMAVGLPCVISESLTMNLGTDKTRKGLHPVRPRDAKDVANQLRHASKEKTAPELAGLVQERFSLQRMVDEYETLFESMIHNHG